MNATILSAKVSKSGNRSVPIDTWDAVQELGVVVGGKIPCEILLLRNPEMEEEIKYATENGVKVILTLEI